MLAVESVAPLQVGDLPHVNNVISRRLPNHLIGFTFEGALAFLPCQWLVPSQVGVSP